MERIDDMKWSERSESDEWKIGETTWRNIMTWNQWNERNNMKWMEINEMK